MYLNQIFNMDLGLSNNSKAMILQISGTCDANRSVYHEIEIEKENAVTNSVRESVSLIFLDIDFVFN